jgi:Protein of unknown function (DUF1579)
VTLLSRVARVLSFVANRIVCCVALYSVAHAQNAPLNSPGQNSSSALMQQMVGTWKVQQRMWPGIGAEAINLPPAVANRHLLAGGFLEEVMEPAKKSGKESFNRTAYFNYNAVTQQYEYFSLDSRAPQMMNERSAKEEEQSEHGKGAINLYGGSFVAPKWGEATNVPFTYRLTVGEIENNSQVVQLYLTPQSGESPKEFLAFEYVYTRLR